MSWYKTGTIAVTNGSAVIAGTGTAWVSNAAAGEAIYCPDGKFYEIESVNGDTSITLAGNYTGTSLSGQGYTILPSQSFIRDLAAQAAALINNYASIASAAGAGKFGDGALGAPGVTFVNDTDTGIRRTASGTFRLVANGVDIAEIGPNGLTPVTALILPGATNPAQTAEGSVVWDTDSDLLTVGDGASRKTMADTTSTQTLTNKTITQPTLTLKQSAAPTPTAEGDIQWDTDDNKIKVGDGAATKTFSDDSVTGGIHGVAGNIVGTSDTQTLTNKTLTSPVINGGATVTGDVSSSGIFKASAFIVSDANVTINDIGTPGAAGFGVGICPDQLPVGMAPLSNGTYLPWDADYGNYRYSDGSIMCWVPAFYYKWGTGANGLAINAVSIAALSAYADEAAANAAGFALHRAFKDGGANKTGVFVDKFIASNNGGTASSIKNGNPLSSNAAHNPFADLTGAPANFYYGAIAAAKTRGANFFCNSRFIFAALAMLSYAHGQASTNTTYCAWYHATNNYPKGCNNNALRDTNDTSIIYVSDGYSNCGKTGSANYFARTTHNGQACGVADLNGLMWEITPGITSNGTNLYILKTTAAMKDVTGGNTLATDLWGATGIAALYDDLGTAYGAAWETGANRTAYYGSASQVFSEATSGNAWNWAGLGGMLAAGDGGTNAFGNDAFYDYKPDAMCPLSGGDWSVSSIAGVWTLYLYGVRGYSHDTVGFRAALYL